MSARYVSKLPTGEIWDTIIEEVEPYDFSSHIVVDDVSSLESTEDDEVEIPKQGEQRITIASFDIGKKNFAHYVEDIDVSEIEHLKKCYFSAKSGRAAMVKTRTPEYRRFLDSVYLTGRRVHTGVYDLRNERKEDVLDNETRKNIINHLKHFRWLWDRCDVFVIEQQFFRPSGRGGRNLNGSQANVDALRISELLIGWLLNEYPERDHMFFGSTNKTQLLGAPPKLGRKEVKKFCIEQAELLYVLRKDVSVNELFELQKAVKGKRLNTPAKKEAFIRDVCPSSFSEKSKVDGVQDMAVKIVGRQKLDDICDACSQLQAFKIKTYILDCPVFAR